MGRPRTVDERATFKAALHRIHECLSVTLNGLATDDLTIAQLGAERCSEGMKGQVPPTAWEAMKAFAAGASERGALSS